MLESIIGLLTYSLVPAASPVELAGFGVTAIVIAVIAVVAAVTSSVVSAEQAKANAKVQSKVADQKARFEFGVALVENEQKRQQAGTENEQATIRGAKQSGAIQALGIGGRSLDRLLSEAKAMTLRDLSDIDKGFEFARQNTQQSQQGIELGRRIDVQSAKNDARSARTQAITSGITGSLQGIGAGLAKFEPGSGDGNDQGGLDSGSRSTNTSALRLPSDGIA